jgi:hypothetical protein
VRSFRETGEPPFVGADVDYQHIRGALVEVRKDEDWRTIDLFDLPAMAAE